MRLVIAAFAACLLIAAPARADLTVTTSTSQAGAPADVTFNATFSETPSSIRLRLPPGLVGNPNAAARCPIATFESGICPADSRVGSTRVLVLTGGVFNLEPRPGEPARLGITVDLVPGVPFVRNQASISLRPDGGLDSTIAQLDAGPTGLSELELTLDSDFMTLPTSCERATVTLNGDSASFTPTGCENVPFSPAIGAQLETSRPAVPSGATVTLTLPEGHSHVRDTEIVLPVGTTLSPGVANGLEACTQAQFDGSGCPGASQVGTVSFVTPLLGALAGKVFFGESFRLYIVVEGPGVLVKLAGDVALDPATGQITTRFENLPQVPFTSFSLSFQGGPQAVLANPTTCGTKELTATLTPWSGTAPRTVSGTFSIDGCPIAAFAPGLRVAADSTAAGRPAGAVTMEISRPDGSEDLARVTTELPPGLAGSLKGVPVCADALADAGACPPETRVGSVSTLAGSGDAPVTLSGTVSLTGPTDGGLAGLAMAIPGRVGPVDLGTVVVRASIALQPNGGLAVRTRPLPRFVGGVLVSIRQLALTLDRPGFILNSSSCALQEVRAVLEGSEGATATVSAPYQASDCAGLPFAPVLEATVGARGRTRSGAFAPLRAVITVPAGHSSTALADVTLPRAIGADVTRLARACPPGAAVCPAGSRIGSAVATTPLLDAALTSPVTLAVPVPGELPGLALQLSGPVTLPLFGKVDIFRGDGLIHNSFAGIPDVPLERFELAFTPASPLKLARDVCRGPRQAVTGRLTGHNGAVANLRARLKVAGCPPVASIARRGRRLRVRVVRGRDAAAIRRVTLKPSRGRTLTFKRTKTFRSSRRAFRLTVRDTAGQTWRLRVRARR